MLKFCGVITVKFCIFTPESLKRIKVANICMHEKHRSAKFVCACETVSVYCAVVLVTSCTAALHVQVSTTSTHLCTLGEECLGYLCVWKAVCIYACEFVSMFGSVLLWLSVLVCAYFWVIVTVRLKHPTVSVYEREFPRMSGTYVD